MITAREKLEEEERLLRQQLAVIQRQHHLELIKITKPIVDRIVYLDSIKPRSILIPIEETIGIQNRWLDVAEGKAK